MTSPTTSSERVVESFLAVVFALGWAGYYLFSRYRDMRSSR